MTLARDLTAAAQQVVVHLLSNGRTSDQLGVVERYLRRGRFRIF
jgi:hypothetical protein